MHSIKSSHQILEIKLSNVSLIVPYEKMNTDYAIASLHIFTKYFIV